jgi:uncharacterized membrane protein
MLTHGRGKQVGLTSWGFSNQVLFTAMLISAFLSLVAAFVLSKDAVLLAADPSATLACNINAVISCGAVALSPQASLFGFPNAFIGLMTEPVVITIALAGLSGVRFKRWFMFIAQLVYAAALVFALWLFFQSAFVIGAFCPWCLLVTVGTAVTFFTLLSYNVRENNLYLPSRAQKVMEASARLFIFTAVEILLLAGLAAVLLINYGPYLFG